MIGRPPGTASKHWGVSGEPETRKNDFKDEMNPSRPANITADRATSTLTILWNDHHKSAYSFALMRAACPCAECRGGHAKMSSSPDPNVFDTQPENSPASRLKNIEAVGTYAITIEWEDGHHFGIYNWNYLRQLCPCPICREQAG